MLVAAAAARRPARAARGWPAGTSRSPPGRSVPGRPTAPAAVAGTSAPSRYHLVKVVTAKVCLRSWTRGRRRPGGVAMPARTTQPGEGFLHAALPCARCPVLVMKNAGEAGCGQSRSRRAAYRSSMPAVVGCSGTRRVWSFLPVTVSRPASRSTSPRSRARASPTRSPVAAIRLIRACMVADGSGRGDGPGGVDERRDLLSGVDIRRRPVRRRRPAGRPAGSGRPGSRVARCRAKPRTTLSRRAPVRRRGVGDSVAQARAAEIVIRGLAVVIEPGGEVRPASGPRRAACSRGSGASPGSPRRGLLHAHRAAPCGQGTASPASRA